MKYQHIVFMQESEAEEAIATLEEEGVESAFEYLLQWDHGEGEETDTPPWGTQDCMYPCFDGEFGYMMYVNYSIPTVGLCKEVE